jgi:hypothetical protein
MQYGRHSNPIFESPSPFTCLRACLHFGAFAGVSCGHGRAFVWGAKIGKIAAILERNGWSLSKMIGPEEFKALAAEAGPLFDENQPVGEYIFAAERLR